MLARIPADVSKRLVTLACAAAVILAACSNIPEGEVVPGQGTRFVPAVADFIDDVGLGNAVTVDDQGTPFYSYWVVQAELEEGELPIQRPIGAPYIQAEGTDATADQPAKPGKFGGAVGLGSVTTDGIFTRGAAAQVRDSPSGVTVPYGPATVTALIGATADNTNGTDVAIAAGTKHVVWTGPDGVWYATGTDSFEAEQVYDYGFALRKAGPIGRPAVAVDGDGNPWIAFTVAANGDQIRVATKAGEKWTIQNVATLAACDQCPPPRRAEIGVTSQGMTIAYIDSGSNALMVATPAGDKWLSTKVADGAAGGIGMTVDTDGTGYMSYYDEDGAVWLATQDGTGWDIKKVADADPGDLDGVGNFEPTTGVAVDDEGVRYVTWSDGGSILLASSEDGTTFSPIETGDTQGGAYPAVAVAADGSSVFVTWYDMVGQDLRLGVQADVQDLQIAAPSPTTEVTAQAPEGCGDDGKEALDVSAQTGNTFDTNCLVAPVGSKFAINFDNTDTTQPHNVDVLTQQGGDSLGSFTPEVGPFQKDLTLGPLDAGDYYFQCDVHPTTMFGTLAVVKAK
jgi:plastocyanin